MRFPTNEQRHTDTKSVCQGSVFPLKNIVLGARVLSFYSLKFTLRPVLAKASASENTCLRRID